jgi:hypothetical protein
MMFGKFGNFIMGSKTWEYEMGWKGAAGRIGWVAFRNLTLEIFLGLHNDNMLTILARDLYMLID